MLQSPLFQRALSALAFAGALFIAPATFGQKPVAPPRHSAVDPVARFDGGWQDRHKSFNQRVSEVGGKAQVIFIGDSITQGWEGEGRDVWARYYSPRNAINLGIGGDRTQHVLWRLDNGNIAGLKPKAAVLMIGTNNSNGEDNAPGQIVDGITAIVERLREKLPDTKIVLLAIFPRSENFTAQRGKLAMINQALRKLADDKNVFWVDLSDKFLRFDGTIPRSLMPDFLHLSKRGYEIWAESIEGKLSELLGDKPVAAAGKVDPSGEWIWKIMGPNDEMIEAPLLLKAEGSTVTGTFHTGGDRKLVIEKGVIEGNELKLVVRRERSQGGEMVYQISGAVEGAEIRGLVETEMNGQKTRRDWSAKRKGN